MCQGERGPIGPAMVGPRGTPGIPGERGEQVSVTLVCLLVVFLVVIFDRNLLTEDKKSLWLLSKTFENQHTTDIVYWFYTFHCALVTKKGNHYHKACELFWIGQSQGHKDMWNIKTETKDVYWGVLAKFKNFPLFSTIKSNNNNNLNGSTQQVFSKFNKIQLLF